MKKKRARRGAKLWSYTAGQRPYSVRVEEVRPGSILHERIWDPEAKRAIRVSLGHRDRTKAIEHANAEAEKLRAGMTALTGKATVGMILAKYLKYRTPKKRSEEQRREDRRRARMWANYLGPNRRADTLGRAEWEAFQAARLSGSITARGLPPEPGRKYRLPHERGVDADLVFMISVLNWSCSWNDKDGRKLLERNPWGSAAPGVKRALERPRNRAPRRPIVTYDRFLAVRAVADQVLMEARSGDPAAWLVEIGTKKHGAARTEGAMRVLRKRSYLPELMDLAEQTGRRVSAICRLWYSDIIREGGKIVALRWRPFKGEDEVVLPVTKATRKVLERIVKQRPGVGDAPLFPSVRKPGKSISRHTADDWMRRAEEIANLKPKHLEGGCWHPIRRKWATERKHHAIEDVMKAGGWKDRRSAELYRQADDESVLAVLAEPRKLMSRSAREG